MSVAICTYNILQNMKPHRYVPVKSLRIRVRRLEIAQTISMNCSMTHSPGKIEYNCRYFIMTFRMQIHKKIR